MADCSEDFLCIDNFDAALAIFCSYCYCANASEAIENIATDEKDYRKCSLCVILWIAISITAEIEKVTCLRTHKG